jgi:wyosine [tRNA(Phe)-imidazoG37] synthetase (radical SAM superfamily)
VITFGPLPSRCLGRSPGVNNIPPKSCSYSCVYCQVGPTHHRKINLRAFYLPEEILAADRAGETIDYLTLCRMENRHSMKT